MTVVGPNAGAAARPAAIEVVVAGAAGRMGHRVIACLREAPGLRLAGIIRPDDHVRRVIIDISVDSAVIVYIERYGDSRLLDLVIPVLGSAEIRGVPASLMRPTDFPAASSASTRGRSRAALCS